MTTDRSTPKSGSRRVVHWIAGALMLGLVLVGVLLVGLRLRVVRETTIAGQLSSQFGARYSTASALLLARRSPGKNVIAYFGNSIRVIDSSVPPYPTSTEYGLLQDSDLAPLAELSDLRSLDLSGRPISDDAVSTLLKLESLEELTIERTKITRDGVLRLREGLPNCRITAD